MERNCVKCGLAFTGSRCKPCHAIRTKKWRTENKNRVQDIGRAYNYKMSPEQFKALTAKQEDKCALCGVSFTRSIKPYIDHAHECCPTQKTCGKCTRGIVCNACNTMLGRLEAIPDGLERIAAYLTSPRIVYAVQRTPSKVQERKPVESTLPQYMRKYRSYI